MFQLLICFLFIMLYFNKGFCGYWSTIDTFSGNIYPGQTLRNYFSAPDGATTIKVYISWSCPYPYNDLDLYLLDPLNRVVSNSRSRYTTSETIYYYNGYEGNWKNDVYGYYFFWYPPQYVSGNVKVYIRDECYEGTASSPWSGSWWPMYTGSQYAKLYDDNGPMEKYDDYVNNGGTAKGWEYQLVPYGHRTTDPSNWWFGHCNGWSAAAILENEPTSTPSQKFCRS